MRIQYLIIGGQMKTIIIVGYISGVIYKLLCTNIIKMFADGSKRAVDICMKKNFISKSKVKLAKLVTDLIMFVLMIIMIILWPITLIYELLLKIQNKY